MGMIRPPDRNPHDERIRYTGYTFNKDAYERFMAAYTTGVQPKAPFFALPLPNSPLFLLLHTLFNWPDQTKGQLANYGVTANYIQRARALTLVQRYTSIEHKKRYLHRLTPTGIQYYSFVRFAYDMVTDLCRQCLDPEDSPLPEQDRDLLKAREYAQWTAHGVLHTMSKLPPPPPDPASYKAPPKSSSKPPLRPACAAPARHADTLGVYSSLGSSTPAYVHKKALDQASFTQFTARTSTPTAPASVPLSGPAHSSDPAPPPSSPSSTGSDA